MVGRKGADRAMERLHALFSGYQGTRIMIEEAVVRSRLDITNTPRWSREDMHRLVAHYLSIRFPICLALNKVCLSLTYTYVINICTFNLKFVK